LQSQRKCDRHNYHRNTDEKYSSVSESIYGDEKTLKYKIWFIDSFRFLSTGFETWTNNLEKQQFKHTRQTFSDEQCELLTRKGVYPYNYVDCLDKLDETQLPPKKAFYSNLNDSDITVEDYERAQKVWKYFDIKTMRGYHNLRIKTYVFCLLMCLKIFEIYA